jgi:hypothetical protein
MKIPHPLEKEVLSQCLDYLALCPWVFAWRNNTGAFPLDDGASRRYFRAGLKGSSDILGLLPACPGRPEIPAGRFLAVETKRPGEKPTLAQEAFLAAVRARGGLALVVHSADELREGLRAEGYEVP